jgi:hypothetical protein
LAKAAVTPTLTFSHGVASPSRVMGSGSLIQELGEGATGTTWCRLPLRTAKEPPCGRGYTGVRRAWVVVVVRNHELWRKQ